MLGGLVESPSQGAAHPDGFLEGLYAAPRPSGRGAFAFGQGGSAATESVKPGDAGRQLEVGETHVAALHWQHVGLGL